MQVTATTGAATSTDTSKRASFTASTCDNPVDFFTRLCAEATALAFDLSELANGSVTRLVRCVAFHELWSRLFVLALTVLLVGRVNGYMSLCLVSRQMNTACPLLSTSLQHKHTLLHLNMYRTGGTTWACASSSPSSSGRRRYHKKFT